MDTKQTEARAAAAADDFENGRCSDCTQHRLHPECKGCQYQHSQDEYRAKIIGSADREYSSRIEAQRLTLAWKRPAVRRPADLSESELFGGPRQGELFQ